MQEDFHYYGTYCAAFLAGFSHEESTMIAYSAQMTDCCTKTFLTKIGAPVSAATTQLQMELMDTEDGTLGLQDITRIWASFHFLPGNLKAEVKHGSKLYKNKFRLICGPNGDLVADTVNLAKGHGLQAAGIAMHVLADTWAHKYFAGTPSFVINNINNDFSEILPDGSELPVVFKHSPGAKDDLETRTYNGCLYTVSESSIMNLGHGRAGHLPDYSFMRYRYLPSWGGYKEIVKDNPEDYYRAFCQMVYGLKFLKGSVSEFEKDRYATEAVAPYESEIRNIIEKRQRLASDDWKAFGEKLSGREIPDFDVDKYSKEYMDAVAADKDETFLGRYVLAALSQKSMVTNKIYNSGNMLAGFSVDYKTRGLVGIKDFFKMVETNKGGDRK